MYIVCFKVANISLWINTGMNIKLNLPPQMKIVGIHSLYIEQTQKKIMIRNSHLAGDINVKATYIQIICIYWNHATILADNDQELPLT